MECVGYGARVILHGNPFSFGGFLTQISEFVSFLKEGFLVGT